MVLKYQKEAEKLQKEATKLKQTIEDFKAMKNQFKAALDSANINNKLAEDEKMELEK